jgi:hypothetical protein
MGLQKKSNLANQLTVLRSLQLCPFCISNVNFPFSTMWTLSSVHGHFLKSTGRGRSVPATGCECSPFFVQQTRGPPYKTGYQCLTGSSVIGRNSPTSTAETHQLWNPSECLGPRQKEVPTLTCNKEKGPTSIDATHLRVHLSGTDTHTYIHIYEYIHTQHTYITV